MSSKFDYAPSITELRSINVWFFVTVIGIPITIMALLINPYDPPGAIDAFINRAYALNFTDLVNRYGPYYYAYRISHFGWIFVFERLFGDHFGYLVWKTAQFSAIAACTWWVLRPLISPMIACGLIAALLTSPWLVSGISTYYSSSTSLVYAFGTVGLLAALNRRDFQSPLLSLSAGAAYSLLVNANTSLILVGGLLFVAYYATALDPGNIRKLVVSLGFAIAGFVGTQIAILAVWSAVLILGSGTPLATIRDWVIHSAKMDSWNMDMFGFVVGRAVMQEHAGNPIPSVVTLLRSGNFHIIVPPVILGTAILFRLWPPHSRLLSGVASFRLAQLTFDPILVSAALIIGFWYVSSETIGNISLNLPYYFVHILPITLLLAFLQICFALEIVRASAGKDWVQAKEKATGVLFIAAIVPVTFILFNLAPTMMVEWFTTKLMIRALIGLTIVSAVVAALPIAPPPTASIATVLLAVGGSVLFLSSSGYGYGEYRMPYSVAYAALGVDIANAQVRLLKFTAKYAPPAGVMPHNNPILNWHPNSNFTDSLSANFLADNFTLQAGHSSGGLPQIDDRAMAQLREGSRRDIVLTYMSEEQGAAAHRALDATGAGYDVLGKMKYEGKVQSVFFEYIRVSRPPAN